MSQLLFKVTRHDCEWEYFRAGGNGGQKQNKTSSACRCRHPPSGAVGESRDERSQIQNRRLAFRRMGESKAFQAWVRMQAAAIEQGRRAAKTKMSAIVIREEDLEVKTGWAAREP